MNEKHLTQKDSITMMIRRTFLQTIGMALPTVMAVAKPEPEQPVRPKHWVEEINLLRVVDEKWNILAEFNVYVTRENRIHTVTAFKIQATGTRPALQSGTCYASEYYHKNQQGQVGELIISEKATMRTFIEEGSECHFLGSGIIL